MKQFWTPQSVYNFLREKHKNGLLLTQTLATGIYATENFCWSELLLHQTELPSLAVLEHLLEVANRLQAFRDTLFGGATITITSAWRSELYNKKIGGASKSKHIYGQAADFCVGNFPPSKVQNLLTGHSGGLGSYKNFTHIDVSTKRRWVGAE